jgi:hypothetical protein
MPQATGEQIQRSSRALSYTEQLLGKVEAGEKLSIDERRHVVQVERHSSTNIDLARRLGVDEKTIRNDIKILKTDEVEDMRHSTDIKLVIADLLAARDRALMEIERGKKTLKDRQKDGTPAMLAHIKSAIDIHLNVTKALQDMGWLPKTLGTMQHKHVFKATVEKGAVNTRRVDLFDGIRDGESLDDKLQREAKEQRAAVEAQEAVIDAEFSDVPLKQLPAGNETGNGISENIATTESAPAGRASDLRVGASFTSTAFGAAEPPHQRMEAPIRP